VGSLRSPRATLQERKLVSWAQSGPHLHPQAVPPTSSTATKVTSSSQRVTKFSGGDILSSSQLLFCSFSRDTLEVSLSLSLPHTHTHRHTAFTIHSQPRTSTQTQRQKIISKAEDLVPTIPRQLTSPWGIGQNRQVLHDDQSS
jgi:hypothetical protein